jgi:hypothetical protein
VDAPAVFRQLRIVFTMISGGGPVPDPAVLADDSLTSDGPASAALHLPLHGLALPPPLLPPGAEGPASRSLDGGAGGAGGGAGARAAAADPGDDAAAAAGAAGPAAGAGATFFERSPFFERSRVPEAFERRHRTARRPVAARPPAAQLPGARAPGRGAGGAPRC